MGVQGLLPFVSSASTEVSLEDYRGQTLACDASVWLHRGAISCARELAEGEPAVGFLRFPLRMIALLKRHGVRPLIVFDGGAMPMKARVDAARAADRESAKARGEFNKTVKITAAMTQQLIERLRQDGVEFVVAPFEADSQLAFLVQHGHAAAALTEDSDLLAYRCPSVLFKLSESGHARRITFAGLQHAQDSKGQLLFDGAWEGEWAAWEGGLFVAMCIMAGCDYLPSVPGVGVATAHKALRAGRTVERALAKLHSKRSGPPAPVAAEAYLLHLRRCEAVFRHARVWDPASSSVIPMHPLGRDGESSIFDFLGAPLTQALAQQVCIDATRDPNSLQRYAGSLPGGPSDPGKQAIPPLPRRPDHAAQPLASHLPPTRPSRSVYWEPQPSAAPPSETYRASQHDAAAGVLPRSFARGLPILPITPISDDFLRSFRRGRASTSSSS